MIDHSRELENALGDGIKRVEKNEEETVVLQRRCLRLKNDLNKGRIINSEDIDILRPAPKNSIEPYNIDKIINKKLNKFKNKGDALYYDDFEEI